MDFPGLKERLGEVDDRSWYLDLYAEALDRTDDHAAALRIADKLYDELPPEPDGDEDTQRKIADTIALNDYLTGDMVLIENVKRDGEGKFAKEKGGDCPPGQVKDDKGNCQLTVDDLAFAATGGGETAPVKSGAVGE